MTKNISQNMAATAVRDETVMIVDDTPANLKLLEVLLRDGDYSVATFTRGANALAAAEENPPDIVLLDINMPEMDGFEVCRRLKADERLKDIPVLFISALSEPDDKVQAFAAGGVDYITKPFHVAEVKARVGTHLTMSRLRSTLQRQNQHLEQIVEEKIQEVYQSQIATIFALAKLAEQRDNDTGKHLERVQQYARLLAEALARDPRYIDAIDEKLINNVYYATPLHDIGKVSIPDRILLKPGKLTVEEFEIMKRHVLVGAETLQTVYEQYQNNEFLSIGVAITRSHHECWDGTGYPDGLAGEKIPLVARIMAVADVYDALRSKRVYKPALSHQETRAIIIENSGTHFDPAIVEAYESVESEFERISLTLT